MFGFKATVKNASLFLTW